MKLLIQFIFYIVINHQRYKGLGQTDTSENDNKIAVSLGYWPIDLDH